ncbi:MAG: AAA family ATPase [Dehalococcoidia bacterium]
MDTTTRLDEEKVRRFASIFEGRKDARGLAQGGCARGEVTLDHYRRHLQGEESLGVYPLMPDSTCRFGAVDIDRKDPTLAKAVYDALAALKLPSGVYMEQSRGKGYHVWLFADEAITAREMRRILRHAVLAAGLPETTEIFPKQDDAGTVEFGNYINLPYFGETDGPRMVLTSGSMQPMPLTRFLTLCQPSEAGPLRAIASQVQVERPTSVPLTENWVVELLAGVHAGGRNDAAARLAGYLKSRAHPEDVTQAILDEWADRCDPAFDKAELKSVVSGIYRRYPDPGIEPIDGDRGFAAVPLQAFLAEAPDRIDWLVEPLIPRGGMVALVGKPASGKTWLALDLAIAIASGRPWLRKYQVIAGPVLLIDEESPAAILKARLELLIRGAGLEGAALPIEVASKEGLNLSNGRCVDDLKEVIARIRPALVVIDAFAEVHRESENSADEVAKIFNRLRAAGRSCDPAFVVLHHNRKDGGTFRGSSHIEATLDTMLAVSIGGEDTSTVEHAKARCSAKVQPFGVRRIISEERGTAQLLLVAPSALDQEPAGRSGRKVDLAKGLVLDVLGFVTDWMPKGTLREKLADDDIDNASLDAALRQLEDGGKIERKADPDDRRNRLVRLAPFRHAANGVAESPVGA